MKIVATSNAIPLAEAFKSPRHALSVCVGPLSLFTCENFAPKKGLLGPARRNQARVPDLTPLGDLNKQPNPSLLSGQKDSHNDRMVQISSSKLHHHRRTKHDAQHLLILFLVIIVALVFWVHFVISIPDASPVSLSKCATDNIPQTTKEEWMNDSTNATVMGMATGYNVGVYKKFVGSLRNSGFQGNIILVVSPNPGEKVEQYLTSKGVTMKRLKEVPCTTEIMKQEDIKSGHDKEIMTCADPYPHLKVRWGRFPILRDHLKECETCTGPVLISDVRDAIFQRDPFGDGAPKINGLQVFEEYKFQKTTHWLVKGPVSKCKGLVIDETMLCSGTTIGTREAMLEYLGIMEQEMTDWMKDPKCCCNQMNGDDQSIHNYLFYTGRFPFATAIKNRMGIVHTVGKQAALIYRAHEATLDLNLGSHHLARSKPFWGTEKSNVTWMGPEFELVDKEGFFLNYDSTRSRVVHQYDRFREKIHPWLKKNGLFDP